ncbi:MAG TPA: biotin/lipoyl-binding protein [Gemmataceae bacterium]|nr:biotin/lipoyl-binding protein [Gemmataceae bacterium]
MAKTRQLGWVRWLLGGIVLTAGLAGAGASFPKSSAGIAPADSTPVAEPVACFGHVDVKHGIASLSPSQPGRVVEVLAEENERVKAGTLLLRLDDTVPRLRIQEVEADLAVSRLQLAQARKLPQQHQARLAQMQAGIEAVQNRLAAARHERDRKIDLHAKDLLPQAELDIVGDQVKEAEALLRAEMEKQAELQLHEPAADLRRAEENVRASEARLHQALEALKECGLRAPSDGKVLRVLVGPGEMLGAQAKQPALLFCPDGARFIRAEVEQEFAHRVQVGEPATIRDESDDPCVWRGRVSLLSDWFTQRRSVLQEPLQLNDVRTLECRILLEPGQPPLRIGQRVRVLIGTNPN